MTKSMSISILHQKDHYHNLLNDIFIAFSVAYGKILLIKSVHVSFNCKHLI